MFVNQPRRKLLVACCLFFYCLSEGFNLEPISSFSSYTLTLVLLHVSERGDKLLAEHMAELKSANEELDGDEGSEEEEYTGMSPMVESNSCIEPERIKFCAIEPSQCSADYNLRLSGCRGWDIGLMPQFVWRIL